MLHRSFCHKYGNFGRNCGCWWFICHNLRSLCGNFCRKCVKFCCKCGNFCCKCGNFCTKCGYFCSKWGSFCGKCRRYLVFFPNAVGTKTTKIGKIWTLVILRVFFSICGPKFILKLQSWFTVYFPSSGIFSVHQSVRPQFV